MKTLASTLIIILLFISCGKLKKEIADLRDEIDRLESLINDNKELYDDLITLLDQQKHISSITETDEKYVIVLSDGSILEVQKYSIYNSPYIGANGNWFVNGVDTGVAATGQNGTDGATPYIGENGNWWVGNDDTGIKADPTDGIDAITPLIGENGNWWIGDTDTGVNASPVDGETPYIGTNGNWWIGGIDTGVDATPVDGLDAPKIVAINQVNNTIEFVFDNGDVITLQFDVSNLQSPTWSRLFEFGQTEAYNYNNEKILSFIDLNISTREGLVRSLDSKGNEEWLKEASDYFTDKSSFYVMPECYSYNQGYHYFIQGETTASPYLKYLRKVDINGNLVSSTLLPSDQYVKLYAVDDGFYVSRYLSNEYSVSKLDENGQVVWTYPTNGSWTINDIALTDSSTILVGGHQNSEGYMVELGIDGTIIQDNFIGASSVDRIFVGDTTTYIARRSGTFSSIYTVDNSLEIDQTIGIPSGNSSDLAGAIKYLFVINDRAYIAKDNEIHAFRITDSNLYKEFTFTSEASVHHLESFGGDRILISGYAIPYRSWVSLKNYLLDESSN